ncbi:MAG: enoyl-CoA hydratase/isomerase family protein [Sandaracinaceae bacterium]|nr:enoyl-CoA hydratase/isomerase family protein [Sandaracinaceae bacterium]
MGVHRISIPARLSPAAIAELERALATGAASSATVFVLEGAGRGVFCEGMDLASLAREGGVEPAVRGFARCLRALVHAPRPTIALVDGDALGGGLGLAAACDLVLASERARVGLPEALFGIVPAMVMPVLLGRTSRQRARLLATRCSTQSAAWAREAGLFDEVAAPERLEWLSRRAARELSRAEPGTATRLRALCAAVEARGFDEALDAARDVALAAFADADVRERVARFIEEGAAPWAS